MAATNHAGGPAAGLRPWREVVTPYPDVTSVPFLQAEFSADLWQVYRGEGPAEYRDAVEFFRRTFITEGLQNLMCSALKRLAGLGGDSVVELQANFGGGKTHSMVALWHLFAGIPVEQLPGLDVVMKAAGIVSQPPKARRAVLVGNRVPHAGFERKPDGTLVRTLWGELGWQLGGQEGYEIVRDADENAMNPGDALLELLNRYAPCLVLIDEWVAYARECRDDPSLHFTFAEILSDSARRADRTLVVVSIPTLDDLLQSHPQRLSSREADLASRSQPHVMTPAEEAFEIVRRRLFQPIEGEESFASRDAVVKAFSGEYRRFAGDFPSEAGESEYEGRMRASYPIHPELFERLYKDWSALDDFHRMRGLLRLMSALIHTLWEREDEGFMILPGSVPVDADAVHSELIRHLSPAWDRVVGKDIDGADSLPFRIDRANPTLGSCSAARRVARTLYLGSAPNQGGLEEEKIKLGCVQPGEAAGTFADALRNLAGEATHLFADGGRYWYSTQPRT